MKPYGRHFGPRPTCTSEATGSLTPESANKLLNHRIYINAKQALDQFGKWSLIFDVDDGLFANYILNKSREEFREICSSHPQFAPPAIISRIYNWLKLTEDQRMEIWELQLFESEKVITDEEGDDSENDPSRIQTFQSPLAPNSNRHPLAPLNYLNRSDQYSKDDKLLETDSEVFPSSVPAATGSLSAAEVNGLLNAPVLNLDIEKVKKEFNIWRTNNGVSLAEFGERILAQQYHGLWKLISHSCKSETSKRRLIRMHNWLKLDEKLKEEVWKLKLFENRQMIVCDASGDITMSDDDDFDTTSSLDLSTEAGQLSPNLLAILNDFDPSQRDCLYPKRSGIPRIRTSKATGSLSAAQVNGLLNEPVLELDIEKVKKEFNIWREKHGVALNQFGEYILDIGRGLWSVLSRLSKGVKSERHFIRMHNWLKLDEKLKREAWKLKLYENREMIVSDKMEDDDLTDEQSAEVSQSSVPASGQPDISDPLSETPTFDSDPQSYTLKDLEVINAANVNKLLNTPAPNLDHKKVKENCTIWGKSSGVALEQFSNRILGFTREGFERFRQHPTDPNTQSTVEISFTRMYNWLKFDEELKRETWKLELFKDGRIIIQDDQSEVQIVAEISSPSPTGISELSSDPPTAPNNLMTTLSVSHNEIPQDSRFKLLKMFYYDLPELPVFKTLIEATPSKFEWLITFPTDPNSDFISDSLFKYDFLPNVFFKLDNSIILPHVSFCGNDPIPFVDYDLHFPTHSSLQTSSQ